MATWRKPLFLVCRRIKWYNNSKVVDSRWLSEGSKHDDVRKAVLVDSVSDIYRFLPLILEVVF